MIVSVPSVRSIQQDRDHIAILNGATEGGGNKLTHDLDVRTLEQRLTGKLTHASHGMNGVSKQSQNRDRHPYLSGLPESSGRVREAV